MTGHIRLFRNQVTTQLICWLFLLWVVVRVDTARRGPRGKPTKKMAFTKKEYDQVVNDLLIEERYEDYASAWMNYIVNLEENVTSQIYHPRSSGGENLCNDIHLLNQELELVLTPLIQQKDYIVFIARRIFLRKGPKFIFELLPDNDQLKLVFNWDDYQLSRFYRLWMQTRMIWVEFKQAYLFMQAKCHFLHKL